MEFIEIRNGKTDSERVRDGEQGWRAGMASRDGEQGWRAEMASRDGEQGWRAGMAQW